MFLNLLAKVLYFADTKKFFANFIFCFYNILIFNIFIFVFLFFFAKKKQFFRANGIYFMFFLFENSKIRRFPRAAFRKPANGGSVRFGSLHKKNGGLLSPVSRL